MRHIIALSLSLLAAPLSAAEGEITIKELTDGAWIVSQQFPGQANALLVEVGTEQLVLVDTLYTPDAMYELLWWTKQKFPKRRLLALNSHFHADRVGGNKTLVDKKVPVYASDETHKLMKERGEEVIKAVAKTLDDRQAAAYRALKPVPADGTFALKAGLELDFGGDKVVVKHVGAGHSPDNVVVWFPGKKILFGGCLVLAGDKPGNMSDADVDAWGKTIDELKAFPAQFVVPGHGTAFTPAVLDNTREALKRAGA